MKDRQLAWSDPQLRELVTEFVPCADEVWRLQNGEDAECALFQRFCDLGHYRDHESTRQGLYVVTPNGRLLGSCNDRRADRVARVMRDALARWGELTPEERRLSDEDRKALAGLWRWADERPEDGLVLEVVTRDLPREEASQEGRPAGHWTARAWNRDYAWFRAGDVAQWLPDELEVGAEHALPREHVERLVRFHLLDSVRGQVFPFRGEDVQRAELTLRVESVDDASATVVLTGATRAAVADGEYTRGFVSDLSGTARWDREERRFTSFELVARGERWGRSRFNERRRDAERAPIGVVMRLAPEDAPHIAPAFVHAYGWRPHRR